MNKTILLSVLLFNCVNVFSFNNNIHEKIVEITITAINDNSSTQLESYLSTDFSIAGQTGEIAKIVLKQLITQLDDTVLNHHFTNQQTEQNETTISYLITYQKMGDKEATFVFDSNNKLKELILMDMQVKTSKKLKNIIKSEHNVIKVPFKIAGKLIALDVTLNGEERTFVLDSGAPVIILNSRYLEKADSNRKILSSTKGVNGAITGMDISQIKSLKWAGIELHDQELITLDISHLEKALDSEIYGLIGYEMIKDYDLLFDYENKELILLKPEATDSYIEKYFSEYIVSTAPLKMENHIPVITGYVDDIKLSLGIDSGAESNLVHNELFTNLKKNLKKISSDSLQGADKVEQTVTTAKLKKILIGGKKFKNTDTVFSDISHLNEGYQLQLDGLIGYPILSNQKTLLSFKNNKIMFFD
jgi:hypothetical protein